jgi:predicted transcriptional regulator
MDEFEEIEELFESSTIKPTFKKVHVILSLYIFDKHPEGIGRYRLKRELLIGSGTARSLITKLNKKINFIEVADDNKDDSTESKRKGHILTEKGKKFLNKIKKSIPLLEKGDELLLKSIIIETENVNPYFCLVKNGAEKISNGIAQRDAAVIIEGSGATCLVHNGDYLEFPEVLGSQHDRNSMKIDDNLQTYFESKVKERKANFEKDDAIVIGLGDVPEKSRLAALNAALTLL